ncbi:MAG: hypothetical protein VKN72_05185 [Nostocales cyanobacterium 94392]|nr:hypothetical protein [Nostocales cyanobacterium 94392]
MNKTFSNIALVTIMLANINPVFAVTSTESSKSELDYQLKSEEIIVAGFPRIFKDIINDADDIHRKIDRMRNREEMRSRRKKLQKEMKRRREQLEAARKAATERQIDEAERRRKYFDSLSPEEKQAYIKQQQELRQRETAAQLFMLGLFTHFLINDDGQTSQPVQNNHIYIYEK